jgi:molybdopterin-synthase adenylyltransferase
MNEERFSRNVALFGIGGQRRIAEATITIVGLGGLGSHVSQQTSYLGVGGISEIDDDIVTLSSMNRVVGAVDSDRAAGTPKVEVAKRLAESVRPDICVAAIRTKLRSDEAEEAISRCDSVFGCVDDDRARLDLIELCAKHRKPFFDLATDTGGTGEEVWYGGRVLFSGSGERCPACMDLLDQRALARSAMTPDQLAADVQLYGVDRGGPGETGPAVVGLNGVVASLAVMEWMVWVTGMRQPASLLEYRGTVGAVFANADLPREGCFYCARWRSS